jgi:hypothetical protein
MGGGSMDIQSLIRINKTIEFLFMACLCKGYLPDKLTVISVGSPAGYCTTNLSRRLRALSVKVTSMACKQPVSLARITTNKHLIGIDERYMFCTGKTLKEFQKMIQVSMSLRSSKDDATIRLMLRLMSDSRISPMTKISLENIAGQIKSVLTTLDTTSKEATNLVDANALIKEQKQCSKEIANALSDLINIVIGDAYTYKVVTEQQSVQVPVSSREQYMGGTIDEGSEVESVLSGSASDSRRKPKGRAQPNLDSAKSLFNTPSKKSSRPPKATPNSASATNSDGLAKAMLKSPPKPSQAEEQPNTEPKSSTPSKRSKRPSSNKKVSNASELFIGDLEGLGNEDHNNSGNAVSNLLG